jgi:hypothetical protein
MNYFDGFILEETQIQNKSHKIPLDFLDEQIDSFS